MTYRKREIFITLILLALFCATAYKLGYLKGVQIETLRQETLEEEAILQHWVDKYSLEVEEEIRKLNKVGEKYD